MAVCQMSERKPGLGDAAPREWGISARLGRADISVSASPDSGLFATIT